MAGSEVYQRGWHRHALAMVTIEEGYRRIMDSPVPVVAGPFVYCPICGRVPEAFLAETPLVSLEQRRKILAQVVFETIRDTEV